MTKTSAAPAVCERTLDVPAARLAGHAGDSSSTLQPFVLPEEPAEPDLVAKYFKVLADPTRVRILELLDEHTGAGNGPWAGALDERVMYTAVLPYADSFSIVNTPKARRLVPGTKTVLASARMRTTLDGGREAGEVRPSSCGKSAAETSCAACSCRSNALWLTPSGAVSPPESPQAATVSGGSGHGRPGPARAGAAHGVVLTVQVAPPLTERLTVPSASAA